MKTQILAGVALFTIAGFLSSTALAQGTAFTYQGRFQNNGANYTGNVEVQPTLWDSVSAGTQVAANSPAAVIVGVTNGLFVLPLDFGANFPGADRWLQIAVRTNVEAFTLLSPRQKLTATPYAFTAANLSGALSPAALPSGGNWPLSSTLTFDTTTLTIDPINDRVGIGTSTPTSALTVRPTSTLYGMEHTDGTRSLSTYIDANGCWFGSVTPDNLFFYVNNGLPSMTIDLAGRVGIGTSLPKGQLELSGVSAELNPALQLNDSGSRGYAVMRMTIGDNYTERWDLAASTDSFVLYSGHFGRSMLQLDSAGLSLFGSSTRGAYAEATAPSGVGVYGFTGPSGTASGGNPAGVVGETAGYAGNGVVGIANNGPSAYGIWGKSTDGQGGVFQGGSYGIRALSGGTAGYFNNLTVIECDSAIAKPQLRLHETQDTDFARLEFQAGNRPVWHIAVGGGAANQMNFYNSTNGDVMSLTEDGTLFTRVLTITGGADIAEPFNISERDLPAGTVVVIDADNPGKLKCSAEAYDRRVAGIISGAGGVHPGLSLHQHGAVEGDQHVALSGRVYVQADASNGSIQPGDLLTTSAAPGHAMKVTDHARAQGAVLGKAMTSLREGKGLVLVLVTLQ